MDAKIKSHTKCNDKYSKGSLMALVISILLAILLFVRIELVQRKSEATVVQLAFRIQRIEEEMQDKTQNRIMEILQSNVMPASEEKRAMKFLNSDSPQTTLEETSDVHYRQKRNTAPSTSQVSLQQIRQEIDKKLTHACSTTDKVCQTGPPGPPGDPGALGYPGYKGEKGAPGKTGPRGALGRTGLQGMRGKEGPIGPQGIEGEKGEKGSTGSSGQKGDVGLMGEPGIKGSIGIKGNKGRMGAIGIQGPKGECVMTPKIVVFPESLDVFMNKQATFYCWVQGVSYYTITWRKLGGSASIDTFTQNGNGVLRISNVTRSHSGLFMCTASTSHGILKAVSSLGLKEPPVFTLKPSSVIQVRRRSTVNLCCEAKGSPPPEIEWSAAQWSPNARVLFQENGCLAINTAKEKSFESYICRATNSYGVTQTTTTFIITPESCQAIVSNFSPSRRYKLEINSREFEAYCHITQGGEGWTLIARFSNNDGKTWMQNDGQWWYDQQVAMGTTNDPSINADMISPAFWLVSGRELKITRSDDFSHTPLLQTTGNCLGGQTFRSKITGYGDVRNGKVWSSDRCLGNCTVQYGGQYSSTDGFQQAGCNGGIQSSNKIGFWCDWDGSDGAVMMIGGGGRECARADHGIGITETDAASFIEDGGGETEYDFGYDAQTSRTPAKSYSLNLWIR